MLIISSTVSISETELDISAIRAQGPGGQNVNKVSSAIHLRFNINQSSLPDFYKQRLLRLSDHRISKDGIVIIKAQQYRSQDKNRIEAIERLQQLIQSAGFTAKTRRPTKPTRGSQVRRVDKKTQHGKKKTMRGKPNLD
ncbi:MAG: aminoacyl-tRNA hydrolase [Porticoccaceae bacterium]|jgi:ribosome-associated protein|nr:aminoacyl-tRNA hydrolase [Porticoccaceae bacterium]MBT6799825.1 aminoacyl-tRNA hydrolase [Porticoccaceae bacterium]MBT7752079.1 aminoacyl-tRNA hydrolase [Porticoccaceae bacterium]